MLPPTIALLFLHLVAVSGQTKPIPDWWPAFEQQYSLADDEVLKRVQAPFAEARSEFYTAQFPDNERTAGEPVVIVVRWGANPQIIMSRFSVNEAGLSVADLCEAVLKLAPYQLEGASELLNRRLDGDWVFRPDCEPKLVLDAIAKILSAEDGVEYSFVAETVRRDVVVVRGEPTVDFDPGETVELKLPMDDVRFLCEFAGEGPLKSFFNRLSSATGWPVIDEMTEPKQFNRRFMHVGFGAQQKESAPEEGKQIPTDKMELLAAAISEQTGLRLEFEQREIERWRLARKE